MMDFLTGLGLMFIIEGASYALFPQGMKALVARMLEFDNNTLRLIGLVGAVFGFLIVAVLRGF